jgi:PAS domain S-box-containing protein
MDNDQLKNEQQSQAQFHAISHDLNNLTNQNPTKIAHHLFTALARNTGVQSGCLFLMNEQGQPIYGLTLAAGRLDEHNATAAPQRPERELATWVHGQHNGVLAPNTTTDPLWASWPAPLKAGSALGVPLRAADHSIGALVLLAHRPDHFDKTDLDRITHLANQAAIIIENARLNTQVKHKQNTIDVLRQTAHAINSTLDLEQILYTVLDQLSEVVPCQGAAILSYEEKLLRPAATKGFADLDTQSFFFSPDAAPLLSRSLRQGRPTAANAPQRPASLGPLTLPRPIHAWIIAPLIVRGRSLGLVVLAHNEPYAYTHQDISNVRAFADHVAAAVATQRLVQETDQRLRELAFLNETGQAITSTLNLEHILRLLLERVRDLLQVDAVSVALLDEPSGELVFEAASGEGAVGVLGVRLKPGQGIAGWVAETGKPLVVNDVRKDSRFFSQVDSQTGMTTQAILCVPIVLKGRVVGVIEALNPGKIPFNQQSSEVLNALAGLAATAIDNARLFAEVRSAESRYEGLFEDSANPIIITDLKGIILDVNRNACSLWSQSKEDLKGLKITHLYSADNTQDFMEPYDQVLANQETTFQTSILSINQRITVEIKGRQVPVKDGTLIQWIGRDISAEIELERTREDMMNMIIHDLRNPLANIMNSLDVLRDELADQANSAPHKELLRIATRSSKRMRQLINSILDLSRLESGQPLQNVAQTDLDKLLRDAMQFVKPQLDIRNIKLTANIAPTLPHVETDADMISRVVLNLLENAIKFTQVGSTVHLAAQSNETDVQVSITDDGPGIPTSQQRTIFEKFVRLQHQGKPKGTGLGLAFCKLAIKAHGGQIWVESAPGQGSTFHFTLPFQSSS